LRRNTIPALKKCYSETIDRINKVTQLLEAPQGQDQPPTLESQDEDPNIKWVLYQLDQMGKYYIFMS